GAQPPAAAADASAATAAKPAPAAAGGELPGEAGFKPAAETAQLRLLADSASGHFRVEDKRSGEVFRSYPTPETWAQETITGAWRNHLRSPAILEVIDIANTKAQPKLINMTEDKGAVESFQLIDNGFKLIFHFKTSGIKIPVEVKLEGDAVVTKVEDGAIEEGKLSLLNMKLYPLFGAQPSSGQEGYMVVPDGPGALIDFHENHSGDKSVYRESIYGSDSSFFNENTKRLDVKMPVFGLKSGRSAFVAVMEGGEEYGKLFASPAGAYGSYNWITPELQYRMKFFQNTSRKAKNGFFTYSKNRFEAKSRTTKYFILPPGRDSYVGMAARYRDYLMQSQGLQKLKNTGSKLPLYLDIVGGDRKNGLLWDSYIPATTTSQAMEMVKRLYGLGVEKMNINYVGWQTGGYSSHGGLFPVDQRLGGNDGMKRFIEFAHSLQMPVTLTANYTLSDSGGNGFNSRYDGLRNLAGRVLDFENYYNKEVSTLVSPGFSLKTVERDLPLYKELGADGIHFEQGIGQQLNSDFNDRYFASRTEAMGIQKRILQAAKQTLGGVSVEQPNGYTAGVINHLHRLADDYSYDLMTSRPIPFAQIALHGLVTYSSEWANVRDQFKNGFLRSVEYGANPSFLFANAESREMKGAYSLWYYSLNYRDWELTAVEEYQRYNQALGDVQDKFITGHRQLADQVYETTYETGKRIIVNYGAELYTDGTVRVPASDFIAIPGGSGP
ncbi:DUF5696 domain-containing protein, partial [Paenibacillus thalictri]|uniref:DUF5696 domain-containing protein n=1 Tax=Paenibacillus thalictri TaxID=2527873 RepID=UPI0013EF14A7